MNKYYCIINRVVDGDTVDIDIDLGFDIWLRNERVRLSGLDAPETRTRDLEEKKRGFDSKAWVEEQIPVGSKQIFISEEFKRGKYGRSIGDFDLGLWTLCYYMVEMGFAKEYS